MGQIHEGVPSTGLEGEPRGGAASTEAAQSFPDQVVRGDYGAQDAVDRGLTDVGQQQYDPTGRPAALREPVIPPVVAKPAIKEGYSTAQKAAATVSLAFITLAGIGVGGLAWVDHKILQQKAAAEGLGPDPNNRPPITLPPSSARTTEPPLTQRQVDGVAAEHLAQANGGLNLAGVFPEDAALAMSGSIVPICEANAMTNPAATYNALVADTSFYISTPNEADAASMLDAMNVSPSLRADYVQLRQQWQAKHPGKMLWVWSSPIDPLQIHSTDNGDGTVTVLAKGSMFYAAFDMTNGVWQAPTAEQLRTSASRNLQSVVSLFSTGSKPSLIGSQVNLFAQAA